MLIRDARAEDCEALRQFLGDNGWGHRIGTREYFSLLLANSQRTAVALHDNSIIGFARASAMGSPTATCPWWWLPSNIGGKVQAGPWCSG